MKNIAYTGIKMSESSFNMLVNSCFKKARDLLAIYDIGFGTKNGTVNKGKSIIAGIGEPEKWL
ncbi:MAG: hypothetical protein SOT02_05110 [Elusimicrobiaceae bacterium]|uniref:hypothetical protein n=1 Tax=Candidatus Avelusimicrobium faecicola TaxID=3416205 RepID=UPI002A7A4F8B|nr:hypothetical protein [Spirochaetota bacterium]MDY2940317.1 hypothetical protein [Elusimicrobiaceae bacterium]